MELKDKKSIIAITFFLAFTICIYAPISIYAVNHSEFWFNLRIIFLVPLLFFLFFCGAVILVGLCLKGKMFDAYAAIVFGFAICFYAQGNFLNLRVGLFHGAEINWDEYRTKMIFNVAIWLMIICVFLFLFLWKSKMVHRITTYLAILLTAMQIVSLTVLLFSNLSYEDIASPERPILTSKGLFEVGGEENIIVFVLDTYDEDFFRYVMKERPEVIDDLDGFVFYDNYSGVYPTTYYSISHFMTGRMFHNEMPMQKWLQSTADVPNYFDELRTAGYEISVYTSMLDVVPQYIRNISDNYIEAPMRFYNMRTCFAILYRLAACQYFPDFIKPYVWMDGTEISTAGTIDSDYSVYDDRNEEFKYNLDTRGISVKESTKEYKFIHLIGVHEAYYIDEWGNEVEPHWDWQPCAIGCTRIMTEYLKCLKEAGVYDDSTIIITADHGYTEGVYRGILSNPVFLMKEKNASGKLRVCSFETSQENFAATIADLCGAKDVSPYGMSILDATEDRTFDRFCYQYIIEEGRMSSSAIDGNLYLVEYRIPEYSNSPQFFQLTDVEYTPTGKIVSHKAYCKNCMDERPLENVFGWLCQPHVHLGSYRLDVDK